MLKIVMVHYIAWRVDDAPTITGRHILFFFHSMRPFHHTFASKFYCWDWVSVWDTIRNVACGRRTNDYRETYSFSFHNMWPFHHTFASKFYCWDWVSVWDTIRNAACGRCTNDYRETYFFHNMWPFHHTFASKFYCWDWVSVWDTIRNEMHPPVKTSHFAPYRSLLCRNGLDWVNTSSLRFPTGWDWVSVGAKETRCTHHGPQLPVFVMGRSHFFPNLSLVRIESVLGPETEVHAP